MATITFVVGGTRTNSKNLWKIQDDGSSLTIIDSADIGSVANVYSVVGDSEGNFYVGTNEGKVYKVDLNLDVITSWGTNGVYDAGSATKEIYGLAVDVNGYLAIAHFGSTTPTTYTVKLLDSTGTLVWEEDHQSSNGSTCVSYSVKFDSSGNVVGVGSRNSGLYDGYKYQRADGAKLKSYWQKSGDGYGEGVWVFSDDDVVISDTPIGPGYGINVRKCSSDNTEEWNVSVVAESGHNPLRNSIVADDDENVYVGGNANGSKTIYKLNASTGVTDASYDTGGSVYGLDIDANGNLVAGGWEAADEDTNTAKLRIFDTDLTLLRYTNDSDLGTIYAVAASTHIPSSEVGEPADKLYSKNFVAVGNDQLWYESSAGTMSQLAASAVDGQLDTTIPLTICSAFQKVFIANQTNLKVADFINTKMIEEIFLLEIHLLLK